MKLDFFAWFKRQRKQPIGGLPAPDFGDSMTHAAPPLECPTEAEVTPSYNGEAVFGGLNWYRTQYHRAIKLSVVLSVAICICLCVIALLIFNRPEPKYFAATPELRLAPLVSLDKPVLTQQGLLNWATETVCNAVSLDFLEWRSQLSKSRENFDEDAFKSFLASLTQSGSLDMIRDKRLSVSAVVSRAPVISASGVIGGKMTWRVEFPIVVSYESSQGVESSQKLMANVLIRRASTLTTPRGVVIQQIVLKRDS